MMAKIFHICGGGKTKLQNVIDQTLAMEKLDDLRHVFQGERTIFGTEIRYLLDCLEYRTFETSFLGKDYDDWKEPFHEAVLTALRMHDPLAKKREREKTRKRLAAIAGNAGEWRHIPEKDRQEMASFLSLCITFCAADASWIGRAIDQMFCAKAESRKQENAVMSFVCSRII